MKVIKNIEVPTGNILIGGNEKVKFEFLSIGDYGKEANIKADFLNLKEDINGVPNGDIMPLSEKWVVTISTQTGCSMGCTFCDVPKVGKGLNLSNKEMNFQITEALKLHPEITATKRLNIHYARMGEPTFNVEVLKNARGLLKTVRPYVGRSMVHPVVSTMMPKENIHLIKFLNDWCDIKNNNFRGEAGLQLSINSTDDKQREQMFNGNSLSLGEISDICRWLPDPVGRKYTLNFALADGYKISASKLRRLFNPVKFIVKLTPMHETAACKSNKIETTDGYEYFTPYKKTEENLKSVGFDVLVFVPSYDEDNSRITCGNAILSDKHIMED